MRAKKTGYAIDTDRQIVGLSGSTGFSINDDDYQIKEGGEINVYIEDGHFYRCGKKLFRLFSVCSSIGHTVDE